MSEATHRALGELRAATNSLHEELEAGLQVIARLSSTRERSALIAGYSRMQQQAAIALAPWLGFVSPAQGAGPDAAAPVLADRAEALGFHYVMVGSALGGRIILRTLEREGVDTAGLPFLNPYGAKTGEVWREVLDTLERELADDEAAMRSAVIGARKGYGHAKACLTAEACSTAGACPAAGAAA